MKTVLSSKYLLNNAALKSMMASEMNSPNVKINTGKLLGKICKTSNNFKFYTFKGIPYAAPPIKELRFAAPELPKSWEGVRDATKDCNICAQFDKASSQVVGDEDCLYLNVYTPSLANSTSSPLPVMVFFHGGGFLFGNGTNDLTHGPDYLVEKNVVVVSLNYRVGILGFLSLGCKEATGNMGLKDQVLALKWVKSNISNFNGDPDNVTIFGFSAGAASVEYLLLSPMAKGLFHKAIANSGSTLLPWAQSNNIKQLAETIPVLQNNVVKSDDELLEFLKSMPLNDLIPASLLAIQKSKWKGGINFGFVPTIENPKDWVPFLCKSTYELLFQGEFQHVPFMSGFCSREGLLMTSHGASILDQLIKEKSFVPYLPFEIDETKYPEMDLKLKSIYLQDDKIYNDSDSFAIDFFTDVDFLGGIYVSTLLIAKKNSPVYFYEFNYDGNLNYLKKKYVMNRKGACHGDDGGYLIKSDILQGKLSDTDVLVKERMCLMWTNFAKFGNPTPEVDSIISTKWDPVGENGMSYLFIDDKISMKCDPYPQRMQLFIDLFQKYYKR